MPTDGDTSVRDGKLMEYLGGHWVVVRASEGPLPMRVDYDVVHDVEYGVDHDEERPD